MHWKAFTMPTCTYLTVYHVPTLNSFRVNVWKAKTKTKWSTWFRIVCLPKWVLLKSECNQNSKNNRIDFLISVTLDIFSASHCSIGTKMKIESAIGMKFWHLHLVYWIVCTAHWKSTRRTAMQSAIYLHASHTFNRYRKFSFRCHKVHLCIEALVR